jgi:hypothetical protein
MALPFRSPDDDFANSPLNPKIDLEPFNVACEFYQAILDKLSNIDNDGA